MADRMDLDEHQSPSGLIDKIKQFALMFRHALESGAAIFARIPLYRHTDYALLFIASVVGMLIGLCIVIFHSVMIFAEALFHQVFLSAGSFTTIGSYAFPFVTALGGLGVGLMNRTLFRRVHGEGLTTLINAINVGRGTIDWRNSIKSILTAALSIASGGGAGREGPTVLLGASLGSALGQLFQLRPEKLRILCAAGAAAAISGIFNAPLAGVIFALEAITGELRLRSFIPLVIASVLATAVARIFMGNTPLLSATLPAPPTLDDYILLALAGMASGWLAVYYLRVFSWTFKSVEKLLKPIPPVWRPALGGLAAGLLAVALPTMLETTYTPINQAISGHMLLWIAFATVLVKPISNAVTLGSGGAGGTFAPALKVGAMFGFGLGSLLAYILPGTQPGLFALVCAGAVLAGTWKIPLTAAILLCEIINNYEVILPLLFSAVFAVFVVERMTDLHTFNPVDDKYSGREE